MTTGGKSDFEGAGSRTSAHQWNPEPNIGPISYLLENLHIGNIHECWDRPNMGKIGCSRQT